MDVDQIGPEGVSQRVAWLVLGAATVVHPLILYLRALVSDGFSDSGIVGGTLSLGLFTVLFTGVVVGLFALALRISIVDGMVHQLPMAVIVLAVGGAHVVAAVGVSTTGSNRYGLAYPVFAAFAGLIVLVLRRSDGVRRLPRRRD